MIMIIKKKTMDRIKTIESCHDVNSRITLLKGKKITKLNFQQI